VSYLDSNILYTFQELALSLDEIFGRLPVVGNMANALDSIFLPRGSKSEEKKQQAMDIIVTRQKEIETTGELNPLLIFPEGLTTNGKHLLEFR